MKRNLCLAMIGFFVIYLLSGFLPYAKQLAVGPVTWNAPTLVYETPGNISRPRLVTDRFDRLHLIFSQSDSPFGQNANDFAIIYSSYGDRSWSPSVDIISDSANSVYPQIAINSKNVALVTYQGFPGSAYVKSARNVSGNFLSARNWVSDPNTSISTSQVTFNRLVVDSSDRFHLLYGTVGSSTQLYYSKSTDGIVWMAPIDLSTNGSNEAILSTDLLVGENGVLHAFWTNTVYPEGYPPVATFYSSSADGGLSWTMPVQIGPADVSLEGAAIFRNNIHVLLIGRSSKPGRYDVWSADDGKTWSSPIIIDTVGQGLSGGGIVADSAGHFHAVFGSDVDRKVVYAYWDGTKWSQPVDISQGILPGLEDIHLAIKEGNQLVALFVATHQRIWTVSGHIDNAPKVTPRLANDEINPLLRKKTTFATPAVYETPSSAMPFKALSQYDQFAPIQSHDEYILWPVLLVSLLVLGVLLLRSRKSV